MSYGNQVINNLALYFGLPFVTIVILIYLKHRYNIVKKLREEKFFNNFSLIELYLNCFQLEEFIILINKHQALREILTYITKAEIKQLYIDQRLLSLKILKVLDKKLSFHAKLKLLKITLDEEQNIIIDNQLLQSFFIEHLQENAAFIRSQIVLANHCNNLSILILFCAGKEDNFIPMKDLITKIKLSGQVSKTANLNGLLSMVNEYINNREKQILYDYMLKADIQYAYILLFYFLNHPHHEHLLFLKNFQKRIKKINNDSTLFGDKIKKEYKILHTKIVEKIHSSLIPASKIKESYCFCCYRKPIIQTIDNFSFLKCPNCEETNEIKTNQSTIILSLKQTPDTFYVFDKQNQILAIEADELLVPKMESFDYDRFMVQFHNHSLNYNINSNIKYRIDPDIHLNTNTKRILGLID